MNRFTIIDLPLSGVRLVERRLLGDQRGFLTRLFAADELAAAGWRKPITDINHTYTARRGTVRGMHFQRPPHAEMKLVSCLKGVVWDVAVDIRSGSPTFLQWTAQELSGENRRAMLIPEGFAHGFQALSDDVEMLYCHSAPYVATAEGGLHATDRRLDIRWPLEISELSARDSNHPALDQRFAGVLV